MIEPKRRVAAFEPGPGRHQQRVGKVVRLGHNERTRPFPDAVVQEIFARIRPEELTALPELEPLYGKLAARLGVGRDAVLLCHGADVGISQVFDAYVDAGDEVVYESPTYHRYPQLCALHAARPVVLEYDAEVRLDFDALLAAVRPTTRLVVLVNPNGTTGTAFSLDQVGAVAARAARCDALVLVDEVYHHFSPVTALALLAAYDNVVIVRSFSKAFGAAGVRVGALVGHPEVIHQLWKTKPRHEISAVSARVAEYLLDHVELMTSYVASVGESLRRLPDAMRAHGLTVLPSQAPAVLVRLPDGVDRGRYAAGLWAAGYEVGAGLPAPHERYIRVTVAPWDQMEGFVAAAGEALRYLRQPAGNSVDTPQATG